MLLLTLWQRFPYHVWRYVHKVLALVYLLLAFHSLVLAPANYWTQPVGWLVALCAALGSVCALIALSGQTPHLQWRGGCAGASRRTHARRDLSPEGLGGIVPASSRSSPATAWKAASLQYFQRRPGQRRGCASASRHWAITHGACRMACGSATR
jgi:hypothetical protein